MSPDPNLGFVPGFDESSLMAELMKRLQPINRLSGKLLGATFDKPDTDAEKAALWREMGFALYALGPLERLCYDLARSLDDTIHVTEPAEDMLASLNENRQLPGGYSTCWEEDE